MANVACTRRYLVIMFSTVDKVIFDTGVCAMYSRGGMFLVAKPYNICRLQNIGKTKLIIL